MNEISHPHDHFIRMLLSDPEKAGTLLREQLPKVITDLLSSNPPELVDGSFVDKELREHLTDRLFRVKTISGKVALLYGLIEHKSFPKRRTAWQLHRYMLRALEQWERENPKWKYLPAIVPFVFYHGRPKWRIPKEFLALVNAEDGWRPYLLNFQYTVMDVGEIPDMVLSRHPKLRAWLMAAKYATRKGEQITIKESLIALLAETGEDFYVIIRYIVEVFQDYDEQIVREIIRRVRSEEEEKMMSLFAQDMLAKGRQEGHQEGRQDGRKEEAATILLKLMRRKFSQLPEWVPAKVGAADVELIETWSDNFVFANSVEEVFAS